ncbi:hypothetical protein [Citrobacter rodentium]|nr:hypothetical protein [Citrobacter rodentium]QBY30909.1 hypothetical protein E2R62_20075 [Citrobacter rodentium]UHO31725.1 hypothetical protein K7R23_03115 [Citrobacter rodentium NBRC 105723 = DSM 16636]HAT8012160.1 hypothetical protein [Citrobacter rodentium NBRC 105723 = DSM 16636]HAT8017211.1 hypothetical protein [Citrobacter rodentium]HAT8026915.1 hypothetical protein [Citrobacter rodentium]
MKKRVKWSQICLLAVLSFCSLSAKSSQNYGFSAGVKPCSLWDTFFPISFQVPSDKLTRDYVRPIFNIIYITDSNLKHMDDFYDIYKINGKGDAIWPTTPFLATGSDTAYCRNDGDCVTKGYGALGKGISAYNEIKKDFPGETVKVLSDSAYGNGDISWLFLPTRKLKLLRVEYFTPYKDDDGTILITLKNKENNKYTEPLFFEYRATGNGDEMELEESGGTAAGANFNDVKLPQFIRPTQLSAIQVWLDTTSGGTPWSSIYPNVRVRPFTDEQMALIPVNCP